MADIVSGDLIQVAIEHPEYGNRIFEPKANEDHNVRKGGFYTDDDDSQVTSAGTHINKMNRQLWMLDMVIGYNEGDLDYLTNIAGSPVSGTVTATYISGKVRSGKGKPVGAVEGNEQAGTIAVVLKGGGTFKLI